MWFETVEYYMTGLYDYRLVSQDCVEQIIYTNNTCSDARQDVRLVKHTILIFGRDNFTATLFYTVFESILSVF